MLLKRLKRRHLVAQLCEYDRVQADARAHIEGRAVAVAVVGVELEYAALDIVQRIVGVDVAQQARGPQEVHVTGDNPANIRSG